MKARVRPVLFGIFASLAALSPRALFAGVGSWTSNGPNGGAVEALAAHASNPSTVYAATNQRLYKSVDSGAHWSALDLSGRVDLVIPTSAPAIVYAARTDTFDAPFFRSLDGGRSWVGLESPRGRLDSVTGDPNDPMTLYAVTISGLFRTANGGVSWESITNPAPGRVLQMIAVDPIDSRLLYAAISAISETTVYRSSDGGRNWSRTALRDPTRALLFDPSNEGSRLFALTTVGLQATTNRGESWRRLARGTESVTHLAIDPTDSRRLYMVSGSGAVLLSSDGGESVTTVLGRDFGDGARAIAAVGSELVLAGSDRGVSRSEDAGLQWAAANRGIQEVPVKSIAVDPTEPTVVFAGSGRGVHESRDGGETWNEAGPGSPDADAVAIDPSDRSTLYAAGEEGFHKSTDGGRTWQRKLADRIADLVIDPNNPRRVLAAYKSVYRSLDGAESWDTVMTPEDDVDSFYYPPRLSAITFAPSNSATVYAAGSGDTGFLYRSVDGGNSWSDPTDLRGFWINTLEVDSCDLRVLQAGGYGGLRRSVDSGVTWSEDKLSGTLVYALARDPRHSFSVFAGTSQGLYWTNDRGESWTRFEPALAEAVRSIAVDPSGRFLYAGTERGVFSIERSFDPCRDGPDRLCLMGSKFQVSVMARNPRTGASITGHAIEEGDQFGYFSFPDVTGDSRVPEVFVKMVDARGAPPPYGGYAWIFHSSLTDLDYTLTVRETETGRVRTYSAADAELLTCGSADTSAFVRACGVQDSSSPGAGTGLSASGAELSLLAGRFRARLQATDPRTGQIAEGAAIPRADGFGYFSLPEFTGDPSFPEIFVKMVDGRTQPGGSFWVFHTGLTDLAYTLTVTDTVTGAVRTYNGGATAGTLLCGSADTMAFRD